MTTQATQATQWNGTTITELEQSLLDAASLALDHARARGASMAEVSIGQGQGMSVTVRKGEVETVEHNREA